MQERIFYVMSFGFIGGVFLRSYFFVDLYFAVLISIVSFGILLISAYVRKNRWGIVASFFILFLSLGMIRFNFADKEVPVFLSKEATLRGIVVNEPEIKENSQRLTVEVQGLTSYYHKTRI